MDKTIILARDLPRSTISDRLARGELARLARGIYTTDTNSPATDVVGRAWKTIVSRSFPDAVVTDRSAPDALPRDGYLFVVSPKAGTLDLPGLTVVVRAGPGPAEGDISLGDGVYLASRPRGLLDNTRSTRARNSKPASTLSKNELADWVDSLCANDGEDQLSSYRDRAEALATELDADAARVDMLNELVGAALGTRRAASESGALAARSKGRPYDQERLRRFEILASHLRDVVTTRPALAEDAARRAVLPFWEAYFSNFIEGTEFPPGEAQSIVFDGAIPAERPKDAHDVLGTYNLVADDEELRRRVSSADEFIARLKSWHGLILRARPDRRPGEFKEKANKAGNTLFVSPDLVEGTLVRGYEVLETLETPTQRGAFVGFLVAEVHPFDDGNGRLSRALMSAEYVSGDEQRAVIPTCSRNDYLRALRRLSRQDHPDLFVAFLDRVRRWTARMDWSNLARSQELLENTNAFVDSTDAEDRGLHLLDPVTEDPALSTGSG